MAHGIEIEMTGGDVLKIEWTGSVYQSGAYQTASEADAVEFAAGEYMMACLGRPATTDEIWDAIAKYYDVE